MFISNIFIDSLSNTLDNINNDQNFNTFCKIYIFCSIFKILKNYKYFKITIFFLLPLSGGRWRVLLQF